MLPDMPLVAAIKGRMQYHQARQKLLAENVANADTPGFRPKDLKPFDAALAAQKAFTANGSAGPAITDPRHIAGAGGSSLANKRATLFETTPSGNSVNLEDEMMRLSQNNSDYQLATTIYSKSLSYLRLALGKRA